MNIGHFIETSTIPLHAKIKREVREKKSLDKNKVNTSEWL